VPLAFDRTAHRKLRVSLLRPSYFGHEKPVECKDHLDLAALRGSERGRVDDDLTGSIARSAFRQNDRRVFISGRSDTQLGMPPSIDSWPDPASTTNGSLVNACAVDSMLTLDGQDYF
jgi:hypothetical protein